MFVKIKLLIFEHFYFQILKCNVDFELLYLHFETESYLMHTYESLFATNFKKTRQQFSTLNEQLTKHGRFIKLSRIMNFTRCSETCIQLGRLMYFSKNVLYAAQILPGIM